MAINNSGIPTKYTSFSQESNISDLGLAPEDQTFLEDFMGTPLLASVEDALLNNVNSECQYNDSDSEDKKEYLLNSSLDQGMINEVDHQYQQQQQHHQHQQQQQQQQQQQVIMMNNSHSYSHIQNNIQNMPFIPQQPAVLTNEDYPGPHNFEILINSQTVSKNTWVYSHALKKIFINMGNPLPIDFKWTPANPRLLVRATPLFSLPQHAQEFVTRCIPHANDADASNKDMPKHTWLHVLRCMSPNAQYQGSIQDGVHLSVVVPLGQLQAGSDVVRHMYQFVCKNSCPSGMNRKPFEVVFTLEKMDGTIIGRRTVSVRVCSCPKRDKDKEENELKSRKSDFTAPKKRARSGGPANGAPLEKKPNLNSVKEEYPNQVYNINIPIVGKHNRDYVLKICHALMVEEASSSGNFEQYRPVINEILAEKNRI